MTIRRMLALPLSAVLACAPTHVLTTPVPLPGAGELIRYEDVADSGEFIVGRLVSMDAYRLVVQRFVKGNLSRSGKGSPDQWVRDSISTDSIARLQVHVGRRGNGLRGALIGTIAGAAIGVLCVSEPGGSGAPSDESCFLGYSMLGAGTGLLIGSLRRSDVWAPARLPDRREAPGIAALESPQVRE